MFDFIPPSGDIDQDPGEENKDTDPLSHDDSPSKSHSDDLTGEDSDNYEPGHWHDDYEDQYTDIIDNGRRPNDGGSNAVDKYYANVSAWLYWDTGQVLFSLVGLGFLIYILVACADYKYEFWTLRDSESNQLKQPYN
jgi:hypothetical protein